MDERLIRLFEEELRHLRETAAEFGRAFPAKAGALALGESIPDPYVERLLEGVAFMAARVRLKLDSRFPHFTQSLLETAYPDLLAPVPSMAVVQLAPNPTAMPPPAGLLVKRGARVLGRAKGDARPSGSSREPTPCIFEVARTVHLLPVELEGAAWVVRQLGDAGVSPSFDARAALRLRLRRLVDVPWAEIDLTRLPLFVPPEDGLGYELMETIFAHQCGLILRDGTAHDAPVVWSRPGSWARQVGFAPEDALLSPSPRTFEGYRFLREYFAMPERLLFFELHGFHQALSACQSDIVELVLPLREAAHRLEGQVGPSNFKLFCTPVVNLFTKTFSQVIEPSRYAEFHIVADANRSLDFEIVTVKEVVGYTESSPDGRPFTPFFQTRYKRAGTGAFFTLNRHMRMLTAKEREANRDVPYAGSEVFISLVDSRQAPFAGNLDQLAFTALCSNRHLPILLAEGRGTWKLEGAIKADVELLVGPTVPSFQPVDGEYAWQLLSTFATNYLSLLETEEGGPSALQELLALHAGTRSVWARGHIEALRRVIATPIQRPLFTRTPDGQPGRFYGIGRGLEVTLEFDEAAFQDRRLFLLGCVLKEFFARYVPFQSFTETVVRTWPDRRERIRWPLEPGSRDFQASPGNAATRV